MQTSPRTDRQRLRQAQQDWRLRALQVLGAHVPLPRHPWGLPALLDHVQVTAWHPSFPAAPWPGAAEVYLSWPAGRPFHATAWARHWNQMHGFPSAGGVPWTWRHDPHQAVIIGHPFDLTGGPSGQLALPQDQIDYAGYHARRPVLGACEDGSLLDWDIDSWPHIMVAGSTGAGKTVSLRGIDYHLLAADVLQALVCLDWKRRDFKALKGRAWDPDRCAGVTVAMPGLGPDGILDNLDDMEAAAEDVLAELGRRMLAAEDDHEDAYPYRRRLILFQVDEALATLQREGVDRDDKGSHAVKVRARNAQRARIDFAIQQVALLGRALNVHLAAGASSPRKEFLRGEAVAAVQHRMYFGPWQDVAEPVVVFGTGQVQSPPPWKGYGIWRALRPDVDPVNPFLFFKGFWVPAGALADALDGRVLPAEAFEPSPRWVPADEAASPWLRAT